MLAIQTEGLYKEFVTGFLSKDRKIAIRDISLEIDGDEIFGILGPNGAGKTTFISIISTILTPDRGYAKVYGIDVVKDAKKVRSIINMSSGYPNFPWALTVYENLRYFAMLYGLHGSEGRRRIEECIKLLELEDSRDVRFDRLSTGMKQRLSIAKSLLNNPKLLLLDEPTLGLDPDIAIKTRKMIKKIHEDGVSILLATHNMKEAEELCREIVFIKNGTIRAMGSPKELKKMIKTGDQITIKFDGPFDPKIFQEIVGIYHISHSKKSLKLVVDDVETVLNQIISKLIEKNIKIKDLKISEPDLEDVFVGLLE
ncbi:MAG: ATP-binding cassette domain-containing protein [Candidatus Hydrothermarchaeota archaeon]